MADFRRTQRPTKRQLVAAIERCLAAKPDLSLRQIRKALAADGIYAEKDGIKRALYRHRNRLFVRADGSPPTWRCKNAGTTSLPRRGGSGRRPWYRHLTRPFIWALAWLVFAVYAVAPEKWKRAIRQAVAEARRRQLQSNTPVSFRLFAWQRQALDAWEAEGHQGVIEAVTGAGKTRLGLVAVGDALAKGSCAHVIVPTIDLQEQWYRNLESMFPDARIGRRGGSHADDFEDHDIIVSVVNSAREFEVGELPPGSVLVADECHRYGADVNAQALHDSFDRRLGLTATYDRDDDGQGRILNPYFGGICFRMGYKQAIADEVTAHFKVALIGVDFASLNERADYERAAEDCRRARAWLTENGWAADEPFGEFMKDVSALKSNSPRRRGLQGAATASAKAAAYLNAFSRKRKLLAETTAKAAALASLVPCVRAARKTIVFTETISAATNAATNLREGGIAAEAIHGTLPRRERRNLLNAFKSDDLIAITAPRVLDEGIDVPEADLAVIFATSKTRRQMVQRMGRVLRRKPDARLARFILLFVKGTTEAPDSGAHESFLDEITKVADDVREFDFESQRDSIVTYINDFDVSDGQPEPRMAD